MQHVELQQTLSTIQEQLATLSAENECLREQMHRTDSGDRPERRVDLSDGLKEAICPYLQLKPMEADERKKLLRPYPKCDDLPKCIKDTNGLAAKAIPDGMQRKWVLTHLPQLQRESLDALRVAATGLDHVGSLMDSEARAAAACRVLQDLVSLLSDNGQRIGQLQLKQAFEAAKCAGAYSMLDLDDGSTDINTTDHTLFQHGHVEAMGQLRKYKQAIDYAKKPAGNNGKNGRGSRGNGRFNNRNGRTRGGRSGGGRPTWNNNGNTSNPWFNGQTRHNQQNQGNNKT